MPKASNATDGAKPSSLDDEAVLPTNGAVHGSRANGVCNSSRVGPDWLFMHRTPTTSVLVVT